MNPKQKNTLLASAIIAGVLAVPMTWFTIHNPQFDLRGGPFSAMFNMQNFNGMPLNVTGFNGSVSLFGISAPLWFVAMLAIGASGLQYLRNSPTFEIPRIAEWIVATIACAWTTIPILFGLGMGKASLGMGWVLGTYCAVAPLAALFLESKRTAPRPLPNPVDEEPDFSALR